jgi:hypothetical protein
MDGKFLFMIPLVLLVSLTCHGADKTTSAPSEQVQKCSGCHQQMQLDPSHSRLACIDCHRGNNTLSDKDLAHKGLVAKPAAAGAMEKSCGKCHPNQVKQCVLSLHFTVKNAVNAVRSHFGIAPALDRLNQIPEPKGIPGSKEDLVNDMLRRQCLRCHVHTPGDNYPLVRRGTGCAACHLQFTDGKLESHAFIRPTTRQCLSCHYGNHVGSDFVGKYEHDFNWEYRTPYTSRTGYFRPYGVELHELAPDIHSQKGMSCLDCHSGKQLAGVAPQVQCISCHNPGALPLPDNVTRQGKKLILKDVTHAQEHLIPQLTHPAHKKFGRQVTCQVCHAQWAFNDRPTHLLLSYLDDVDPWERLTVQSNSAVERFLDHNLNSDEDELLPAMQDALTGKNKSGIWYKGFGQRRWEKLIIKRDSDDIIKVFRPILDLRLSAVDDDENVLFDNLRGKGPGLLPYTPHTSGAAGVFYEQRFRHLLRNSSSPDHHKNN